MTLDKRERHRRAQAKYRNSLKGRLQEHEYRSKTRQKRREYAQEFNKSEHGKELRRIWDKNNPDYQKKRRICRKKMELGKN